MELDTHFFYEWVAFFMKRHCMTNKRSAVRLPHRLRHVGTMVTVLLMCARTIAATRTICKQTTRTKLDHRRTFLLTTTTERIASHPQSHQRRHQSILSRIHSHSWSHRCAFITTCNHHDHRLLNAKTALDRRIHIRSTAAAATFSSTTINNEILDSKLHASTIGFEDDDDADSLFYASSEFDSFDKIGIQSSVLLERLDQKFQPTTSNTGGATVRPSRVQAAAFPVIQSGENVVVGAETGSGKTLAYLLPLLDDILQRKQQDSEVGYEFARALILVPNKELVHQVIRMALDLCGGPSSFVVTTPSSSLPQIQNNTDHGGTSTSANNSPNTIIRMAVIPGGLSAPDDFAPFRRVTAGEQPPIDLLISTPAAVGQWALSPRHIEFFADIRTVVMDEADMLLDGGYLPQLEQVLMGFRRADRLDAVATGELPKTQFVFSAATLPNSGLKSVEAYLERKFPRIQKLCLEGMHNAKHSGLRQQPTRWFCIDEKKERMQRLVQMLNTPYQDTSNESNDPNEMGLQGDKVMIFLNTVQDVDTACVALNRAGVLCVPYHAKLSLTEKSENLERFRIYQPSRQGLEEPQQEKNAVPVLICTDLASRGLDVPGVTTVVQLQFAGNVVAHLHRMGRCGRAGAKGRGIVFYSEAESELVEVVREAEERQEQMVLEGDVDELEQLDDDSTSDLTAGDVDDRITTARVVVANTEAVPAGSVQNAFSRRRGFSKKRKKQRRDGDDGSNYSED